MKKHINICMEGHLNKSDFNLYSQVGAYKYGVQAIYKNGDFKHADIEEEGESECLVKYIEYLQNDPLKNHIYLFRMEEAEFCGLNGFISRKVYKDDIYVLGKIAKSLS